MHFHTKRGDNHENRPQSGQLASAMGQFPLANPEAVQYRARLLSALGG